jgi:hypothetical protein
VIGRTVFGSSLTINFRVAKLDDLIVTFTRSLQTYSKLGVDANEIMCSLFNTPVMCGNAILLSLVSLKVAKLITGPMIVAILGVWVNVCSSTLD